MQKEVISKIVSPTGNPARIFVVGCSRSGTTLTQTFFSAHPDIHAFPETSFFFDLIGQPRQRLFGKQDANNQMRIKRFLANLRVACQIPSRGFKSRFLDTLQRLGHPEWMNKLTPASQFSMKAATNTYLEILDAICKENNAKVWCEKTPNHVHYIKEIMRYVPDARFIHVIREGCDVAASIRDAAIKYPDSAWSLFYPNAERTAKRWVQCIIDAGEYIGSEKHIAVRYEALAENPEPELIRLCQFIGIPYDKAMIEDRAAQMDQVTRSRGEWRLGVQQNVATQKRNKFDKVFNKDEQSLVKTICATVDVDAIIARDLDFHPQVQSPTEE